MGFKEHQNKYFQRKLGIDIFTVIILSLYYGRLYSLINYQPDLPDDTKYCNVGTLMNMIDRGGGGEGCPGRARGNIIRRDFTNVKGMILLSLNNIRTSIALFPWRSRVDLYEQNKCLM